MGSLLTETYFIYRRNLKTWLTVPGNVIAPLFISGLLFVLIGAMFDRTIILGGFGTEDYRAFLVAWIIVQVGLQRHGFGICPADGHHVRLLRQAAAGANQPFLHPLRHSDGLRH